MNRYIIRYFSFLSLLIFISCNTPRDHENTIVVIKTTFGDIKLKLYDKTPIHRDNFIKLINSGFYDGVTFQRIIKGFMIQAGDPDTRIKKSPNFPDTLKTYTIPPEFNNDYFHKIGALAAARQGNDINPDMKSSGTQFYIVVGVRLNDEELTQAEQKINSNIKQARFNYFVRQVSDSLRLAGNTNIEPESQEIASVKMFNYLTTYKDYNITAEQRNIYKTAGGTPRLDGTYTVFGEVTEGMDIVDKISEIPTDSNDKPLNDVRIIKIKIIKN